jgi:DNA-damage-inducible protein J
MGTVSYSFRIDENTKEALDEICHSIGMSTATAFNLFAKRVVAERGLPFTPAVIEPTNQRTASALREMQSKAASYSVDEGEVLQLVTDGRR